MSFFINLCDHFLNILFDDANKKWIKQLEISKETYPLNDLQVSRYDFIKWIDKLRIINNEFLIKENKKENYFQII
jgi:hypothetical protein